RHPPRARPRRRRDGTKGTAEYDADTAPHTPVIAWCGDGTCRPREAATRDAGME
ncbi:unnamed protein product, partial [Musa textilis]